jgi:hypothetical protein
LHAGVRILRGNNGETIRAWKTTNQSVSRRQCAG